MAKPVFKRGPLQDTRKSVDEFKIKKFSYIKPKVSKYIRSNNESELGI
jgi:hypothetical protein